MATYAIVFKVEGIELRETSAYFKRCLQQQGCEVLEVKGKEELLVVEASHGRLLQEASKVNLTKQTLDGESKEFNISKKAHFQGADKEDFLLPFEKHYLLGILIDNIKATTPVTFLSTSLCLQADGEFSSLCKKLRKRTSSTDDSESLLLTCKMMQLVDYATPVHNSKQIGTLWKSTRQSLFVPLDKMRDYFGEEVTFYYAWMNFYTRCLLIPAMIGLVVYILNTHKGFSVKSSPYIPFFSIFMVIWSGVFLKLWRRRTVELSYDWDTLDIRKKTVIRPGFKGMLKKSPITGKDELCYPPHYRLAKCCISALVTLCLLCVAFMVMTLSLNFQGYVHKETSMLYNPYIGKYVKPGAIFDPTNTVMHYIPVLVHIITIQILNRSYRMVAEKLTDWENHKTEQDHESSLILKRFFFEAFDCYIALFYLTFIERDILKARTELSSLYMVDCLRRLLLEVALPSVTHYFSKKSIAEALKKNKKQDKEKPEHERAITDTGLDKYEEFDDYLEMVIAYGYITMFASVFPFASFVQIIYNLVEMKSDAFKLCFVMQRPKVIRQNSIGSWQTVLQLQAWLSIFTNLGIFLIMSDSLDFFCSDEIHCVYLTMFGFEHVLLILMLLLFYAFSDTPQKIDNALQRRQYILEKKNK